MQKKVILLGLLLIVILTYVCIITTNNGIKENIPGKILISSVDNTNNYKISLLDPNSKEIKWSRIEGRTNQIFSYEDVYLIYFMSANTLEELALVNNNSTVKYRFDGSLDWTNFCNMQAIDSSTITFSNKFTRNLYYLNLQKKGINNQSIC